MKKLASYPIGNGCSVRVYRKAVTDEYVVRMYGPDNRAHTDGYYTDNRDDAFATAKAMVDAG